MMKRFLLVTILSIATYTSSAEGRLYETPFVISADKELPRSVFMSFRKQAQAMLGDRDSSLNYVDLNGEWRLQLYSSEGKLPANVTAKDYDISKWKKIAVPSAWELGGDGTAVYAEKAYDFAKQTPMPGQLPSEIPVAVYSRDFSFPKEFFDKALFIHFGAAKAAITVYVNGQEVGYSQDSKNPAEFDITKLMVPGGRNRVTVKVAQWSQGSFLENQSQWRLSGLNRDVFLFCQPKIRVRDFIISTTLDPSYQNGLLETAMLLKTQLLNPHTVTVHYDLYDPQGTLVNSSFKDVRVGLLTEDTVRFTASISNVKKWNAETPELYTILYRVKREGRWTECVAIKAGFRTIEVKDQKLMINGAPVTIKGVNMGEHTLKRGNYMDDKSISDMLLQMKQSGINAVRTDGYPLPDYFYRECDRLGLYVCDVANINTQGLTADLRKGGTLANDPAWRDVFVDRVNNTYERSKIHPSVIMVGLGDQAGNGYNMYQAYLAISRKDHSRPIVYDAAGTEWNTDIYCPTYPAADRIKAINSSKPVIPSRVKFDPMYWTTQGIQGAFLDNWQSQDLQASGAKYARLTDDYKMTALSNGNLGGANLTDATGRPSAELQKISSLFANVIIEPVDEAKGVYQFENRLDYTNLDRLDVNYTIMNGDRVNREGVLNVSAAPGEKAEVTIPGAGGLGSKHIVITVGNLARYQSNK